MKGTTKSGFEFNIDEDLLDDWEFFEVVEETDDNPYAVVKMARMLLGDEQYKALKSHLKKQNGGRIRIKTMSDEITEIFTSGEMEDDSKNS